MKKKKKKKKKKILVDCEPDAPGACHRVSNSCANWTYEITTGFVLAWIAIIVLQGAHYGTDKRAAKKMWRSAPYGPTRTNSCVLMLAYIHFVDNNKRVPHGQPGYDPLFKRRWFINAVMKGIHQVWTAGQNITIDESMIPYSGRAIKWVQYMPAKPIKHSIKVLQHVVPTPEYCWLMMCTVERT